MTVPVGLDFDRSAVKSLAHIGLFDVSAMIAALPALPMVLACRLQMPAVFVVPRDRRFR
jgi:hypothetical protein